MAGWERLSGAGLQSNGQNDQPRQRQETVPGWERIVEIVDVQAMRSGVSKAYLRVLFWIVGVIMVVAMVMPMIVRFGVGMIMRGRMVRMRSRSFMG